MPDSLKHQEESETKTKRAPKFQDFFFRQARVFLLLFLSNSFTRLQFELRFLLLVSSDALSFARNASAAQQLTKMNENLEKQNNNFKNERTNEWTARLIGQHNTRTSERKPIKCN